jgi:hypothetical protein
MMTADAVLVCALALLGRPASSFPPIVLVDTRPDDVTPTAEAFVRRDPAVIHLVTTSIAFRKAQAGNRDALKKLASMVVHEEWHLRNGPDEGRAYQAQLAALFLMGIDAGRPIAREVQQSMRVVVAAQKRAAQQPGILARP